MLKIRYGRGRNRVVTRPMIDLGPRCFIQPNQYCNSSIRASHDMSNGTPPLRGSSQMPASKVNGCGRVSTAGVQVLCSEAGASSYRCCMDLPYSMCARPQATRRRRRDGYGSRCNSQRRVDELANVACTCKSLFRGAPSWGYQRQIDIHDHKLEVCRFSLSVQHN